MQVKSVCISLYAVPVMGGLSKDAGALYKEVLNLCEAFLLPRSKKVYSRLDLQKFGVKDWRRIR